MTLELQQTRLPCPPVSPRVCLNSCSLSQWCYPIISSSVTRFSSHPQSFPSLESFPVSQLSVSGGQIIGTSATASVLPMNIQDWFPLGLTGLISLQPKRLSRAFSSTTIRKPQFFGAHLLYQPFLWLKLLCHNKAEVHEEVSRDRGFYFIICGSHWCDFRSAPHQIHLYDM